MKIHVDLEKCHGSGECLRVCPHGAIQMMAGKAVVDHEKCDLDGLCLPACPHDAISFSEES